MNPQQSGTLLVEGVISKIIYRNEENSYLVMEVQTAQGAQVVVGYAAGIVAGESVRAAGEYATHPSYGRQFVAATIDAVLPTEHSAILAYLESGAIKGIGKVLAGRIVDRFGTDALRMLEEQPQRLCEVQGISPDKARMLAGRFAQAQGVRRLLAELQGFQLPPFAAVRLYKRYGMQATAMLRQNPYLLCEDAFELDFEQVDEAALTRFEIAPTAHTRIMAGIQFVLRHNLGNGHTFLPFDSLVERASDFLSVPEDTVLDAMDRLQADGSIVECPVANLEGVFLARYHEAESSIAARLLELSVAHPCKRDVPGLVGTIEQELSIAYAALQRRAIAACATDGVFVLTGGPGTGKTTTLRGILKLFEALGLRTMLCAPTGRAAKRMSDLAGCEASTIHRMLGMTIASGAPHFRFDERNPLETDVVIVDEVSMLEVTLFEALLRAMPRGCRLVLVGDSNQLPPVGAGNILRDLLGSCLFPSVELTEIFRQARDSLIVVNAHRIMKGEYPEFNDRDNDFFLVSCPDRARAAQQLADLVARRLPKAYKLHPLDDIQVITPTRRSDIGTGALNEALQQALNPPAAGKQECKFMNTLFRVGDKVMQTKNNYELTGVSIDTGELSSGLFNGDLGRIADINPLEECMTIRFDDRQVEYPFDCLHQLELAYAVTVHKSQGSEYPAVVFAAFPGMGRLQTRNLLYTAVTRARSIFVALGSYDALCQMTDNQREDRRFSALKYLLLERVRNT